MTDVCQDQEAETNLSIGDTVDRALLEIHLVHGERSRLVREDVLNLSEAVKRDEGQIRLSNQGQR